MKVKGLELKPRTAYDSIVASSFEGGNILLTCSKIIYDSIKRSRKFYQFWFRWKYSPSKILKSLEEKDILKATRYIRIQEGAKEEDLIFIDYHLGDKTFEEFSNWIKANKKKVETIQSITQ